MKATLHVDASHCPNTNLWAYGYRLSSSKSKLSNSGTKPYLLKSSIEAELHGAISAISSTVLTNQVNSVTRLNVVLDNKLIVDILNGTKEYYGNSQQLLKTFRQNIANHNIKLRAIHVHSHSTLNNLRNSTNNHVDALALSLLRRLRKQFTKGMNLEYFTN